MPRLTPSDGRCGRPGAGLRAVDGAGDALAVALRHAASIWVGPHLLNTLRAVGETPAERKVLTGQHEPATGKLAELRAAHRQGRRSA